MNPELHILEILQLCHPRGLREAVLGSELRVRGVTLSLSDQARHVRNLESKHQVTVTAGEDYTLIKITPEGLSRLAEQ